MIYIELLAQYDSFICEHFKRDAILNKILDEVRKTSRIFFSLVILSMTPLDTHQLFIVVCYINDKSGC